MPAQSGSASSKGRSRTTAGCPLPRSCARRSLTIRRSVAAVEHAFTDQPPSSLYLDTDVCLAYLIPSEPLHERAAALFALLATYGYTTVYVSSLSWIEFVKVITSDRFRKGL